MGNKMLIDAAHPEETRVVVLRGNRVEEFDFEAASKRQLRGNIYLAKVTRVEPSLQAAFIEYGGNRHGFLAFSEIHPDYYQIPVADRQLLLEEEARSAQEEEDEPRHGGGGQASGNGHGRRSRRNRRGGRDSAEKRTSHTDETVVSEDHPVEDQSEAAGAAADDDAPGIDRTEDSTQDDGLARSAPAVGEPAAADDIAATGDGEAEGPAEALADPADGALDLETPAETAAAEGVEARRGEPDAPAGEPAPDGADQGHDEEDEHHEGDEHHEHHEEEVVEQLGGDALEDVPHRVSRPRRNYKIQEVIKRRQVLLVQVVKEERGNKGAALTTYLSLAGRYSVLMPNTARGGGISRKIADPEDRKRLKAIAQELEVPEGMGIILRTAGASRGLPEVKRDFEYLMRMWETVRETTLQSSAPTLVYEEGSLIKRSIRDLFTKDVDEVVVSGDEGYREAKEFMRLLMPNQVRSVVPWRESQPLFAKAGAEAQLDAMFSSQVVLKSGGYLVINQTEALVAIDVNSGRSTREHNIEDTALRTNLEASDEIARQLRLRDLAGLIVVDFIDMEEGRNDKAVERRLKDALKNDRARIQIGRISHFGLLEMSRQRMRTGVLEGSTVMCAHCAGSGTVRSVSSIALHVLRLLEDTLIRSAAYNLIVRTRSEVALYILNQKRANLLDLEARFGVAITVMADPAMTGTVYHAIERGGEATPPLIRAFSPAPVEDEAELEDEGIGGEDLPLDDAEPLTADLPGSDEDRREPQEQRAGVLGEHEGGRRRRRRRRRRGGRDGGPREGGFAPVDQRAEADDDAALDDGEGEEIIEETGTAGLLEADADRALDIPALDDRVPEMPPVAAEEPVAAAAIATDAPEEAAPAEETAEAPRRRRSSRRTTRASAEGAAEAAPVAEEEAAPPRRSRRSRAKPAEALPASEATVASADRDVGADTVQQHGVDIAAEPELPLAAAVRAPASAPSPAPQAEAEPDRPKRSGWWQRAKATFSAGS